MKTKHAMMIFMIAFVAVMIYCGWLIYDQHVKIAGFQPVEANILSARIRIEKGTGDDSHRNYYWPDIEYEYLVNQQRYTSRLVYPSNYSMSEKRAERIVNTYPPGRKATAYCNPENPSQAFLIKKYRYFPAYLAPQIMMALIMVILYLGFWRKIPGARPSEPIPATPGWFTLRANSPSLSQKRLRSAILALIWLALWCATSGHYFWFETRPFETMAIIAAIICGLVTAGMILKWISNHYLASAVFDVQMLVDRDQYYLGDQFSVTTSQTFKKKQALKELKIGLVCQVKSRQGSSDTEWDTTIEHEQWFTSHKNLNIQHLEQVQSEWSVQIPTDKEPTTTELTSKDLRRCIWQLEYQTMSEKKDLIYKAIFPILVEQYSQ